MIYFVDFEDSFNFNILSYLNKLGSVQVVHYKEFPIILDRIGAGDILCLGPGPGHIDEYSKYLSGLKKIYHDNSIFKFGLCLGHQLFLALCEDVSLKKCESPQHGQRVELQGGDFFGDFAGLSVQRYNSWTVDQNSLSKGEYILDEFGEVAAFKYSNHVFTVQFHPESIGTSCPDLFFQPLGDFLRYSKDDGFDQASRNLR